VEVTEGDAEVTEEKMGEEGMARLSLNCFYFRCLYFD